ncbi:MAG: GspE/PulE family protein, partial [Planctomycetota bacterium]
GAETGRVVLSVEDPVEMRLPAITQTQIRPAIGLDFPTALRSLLRQDPDVLMIGEIRDAETAAVALQAAGTGHLVLSSLHCGSAAAVPDRLLDMGLPAYAIAGALRLVCCQRLLRRLCTDCRRQDHEAWEAIGCDSCHQTGYDGRVLVAEHCLVEEDLRRAIARGQPRGPARAAVARPIAAGIAELLRDGITSPAEAARQEDQA